MDSSGVLGFFFCFKTFLLNQNSIHQNNVTVVLESGTALTPYADLLKSQQKMAFCTYKFTHFSLFFSFCSFHSCCSPLLKITCFIYYFKLFGLSGYVKCTSCSCFSFSSSSSPQHPNSLCFVVFKIRNLIDCFCSCYLCFGLWSRWQNSQRGVFNPFCTTLMQQS